MCHGNHLRKGIVDMPVKNTGASSIVPFYWVRIRALAHERENRVIPYLENKARAYDVLGSAAHSRLR